MTRRDTWLNVGVVLVAAVVLATAARAATGDGYEVLGDLAVMDQGRIKPLDTLAIVKVKSIHGRSTITLTDEKGQVLSTWGPVATLLDWSVRPEFWNDQAFILAEYLPLKRKLLAGPIREELQTLAAKASGADKTAIEALIKLDEYRDTDLRPALTAASVSKEDRLPLARLTKKLSGDQKYLSPNDLQQAEVVVDKQSTTFTDWFRDVMGKREMEDRPMGGRAKKSELDDKVAEVGIRLFTYQALRDRNAQGLPRQDMNVLPHPCTPAYVAYVGSVEKRFSEGKIQEAALSPLATDALRNLSNYLQDMPPEERATPGSGNAKFDARFTAWLRDHSEWLPLRVVLQTGESELIEAGFPAAKVQAFQTAFRDLDAAENAAPGQLPVAQARAVVAAARDLGGVLGTYPSSSAMARESHFNRFAPSTRRRWLTVWDSCCCS